MNINFWHRKFFELYWLVGGKKALDTSRGKGWYGEWRAYDYLRKQGFKVLNRNWRSSTDRRREIDLICMDEKVLVFVEVRARSANHLITGYQSLTPKKKKALSLAGRDFILSQSDQYLNYRFDVVEIDLDGLENPVFHHQNVSIFS